MMNAKTNGGLHLLNETAKEKSAKVQKLLSEKYSDFVEALQEAAIHNKKNFNRIKKTVENAVYDSGATIKNAAIDIDRQVKKNPWPYIGGATFGALLIGFLTGRITKK